MELNTNALPVTDPRHPLYYEPRAGYPLPTLDWFYDGKELGHREYPTYTQERFLTGMNGNLNWFYYIRKLTTIEILNRGLHNTDLDTTDADWDLEEMREWVLSRANPIKVDTDGKELGRRLDIMTVPVPIFWRFQMARQFIVSTIHWIRQHNISIVDQKLVNIPAGGNWRWGPIRKAPKFEGMFQLQHLHIVVQVPGDQCAVRVRDIIDIDSFKFTYEDVDKAKISFKKLETRLQAEPNSPYSSTTHALVYQHPDSSDEECI